MDEVTREVRFQIEQVYQKPIMQIMMQEECTFNVLHRGGIQMLTEHLDILVQFKQHIMLYSMKVEEDFSLRASPVYFLGAGENIYFEDISFSRFGLKEFVVLDSEGKIQLVQFNPR